MSDIKVGDLVYVAHPTKCCNSMPPSHVLSVFIVGKFAEPENRTCNICFKLIQNEVIVWDQYDKFGCPVYMLEKFKDFPQEELREATTDLPVTA